MLGVALSFVLFIVAIAFIIWGGRFLVNAAININKITGISKVIIGATFIAVATTAPEIFISILAVVGDNHGLAIGSAVGSMIVNIALILALYITFLPTAVDKRDILKKSAFLIFVILFVFVLSWDLRITSVEGVLLVGLFIVFIWWFGRGSSGKKSRHVTPDISYDEIKRIRRNIILEFMAGQAFILAGAFLLVQNGERIAHIIGASETVVGLTLIAIGTSAPELATVITSIRRKSGDLAIGSILGSNIVNSTLLLGIVGMVSGTLPLSAQTLYISLPILLVVSLIAVLPMVLRGKTYRWQGIVLVAIYTIYILYLVIVQPI
ncbi:MAG: calcium/sodium antiporter [Firmicutes bacterium]|nr:calcium/sodium antiporter [Bacillota bacterium]